MQNLFWAACGKWRGESVTKQECSSRGNGLGVCVPILWNSEGGGTWDNQLQTLWGGYKLVVDISHIEDVYGGHGAPKKNFLGESMGHEEFIFAISNSLEEFHCFPFLVYGVNPPYVHTHYAQLSLTRSGPGRLLAHRWLLVITFNCFLCFLLTSPTQVTWFASYWREKVTRTLFLLKLLKSLHDDSNNSVVINIAIVTS